MRKGLRSVAAGAVSLAGAVAAGLAMAVAAAAAPIAADGVGCTDQEIAASLIPLEDNDPRYIEIWVTGMQDGSCRGYSAGQEVTVSDRTDDMACVRAADDATCFWVPERMAPKQ